MHQTIMLPGTLYGMKPKTVPALLSAARSEFLVGGSSYEGQFMREIASLFDYIAKQVFASKFVWSDYNRGQWEKFVDLRSNGLEGGACMFSFENHAEVRNEGPASFQGLGVGVPTGIFPYSLWLNHKDDRAALLSAVATYGPYSLDLISDD